jgi:hypothetical protein
VTRSVKSGELVENVTGMLRDQVGDRDCVDSHTRTWSHPFSEDGGRKSGIVSMKLRTSIRLLCTNQRGDIVSAGEAAMIPPQKREELISET